MSTITNELKKVCLENGDKTAFIYAKDDRLIQKSYSELWEDVRSKKSYIMQRAGCGSRLLAFAKESYELCVFMIAAMSLGASVMYIDIWAKKERLCLGYEQYRPHGIVVSKKTARLKSFFSGINKIDSVFYVEKAAVPTDVEVSTDEDTVALITMTTGSTGEPKAAIRTHGQLWEQLKLIKNNMNSTEHETVLTTSFMYVFANILNGFTTVLGSFNLSKDSPRWLCKKLGVLKDVPLTMIFTTPDFCMKTRNIFPSLGKVFVGGAVLNLYEARTIQNNYKGVEINYIYGATECNLITRTTLEEYIEELRSSWRSCLGKAVEGVELRSDDAKRISVSSDALLKDYLCYDDMKNKLCDGDGRIWHMTGDAGYICGGKLYYSGRNDMRIGADGIYSNEAEQALCASFSVLEKCAVLAKDDVIYLFVQSGKGSKVDTDALRAFLRENFSFENVKIKKIKKISCDVKHHTKIDYKKLKILIK